MNNPILNKLYESRLGRYCHCFEVSTAYDLECICEAIWQEFIDGYSTDEIVQFLETAGVYCMDDENEAEVYDFSFSDHIKENYL